MFNFLLIIYQYQKLKLMILIKGFLINLLEKNTKLISPLYYNETFFLTVFIYYPLFYIC